MKYTNIIFSAIISLRINYKYLPLFFLNLNLFYFLEMVYKYCTEDGKWQNVTNLFGSTDYSSCYTPELTDMLKKLGSDYDTKVL